MTALPAPSSPAPLIAGAPVTYNGSVADFRGGGYLLLPHGFDTGQDNDCDCEFDRRGRHTLVDFTSDRVLNHVRTQSFTPTRTDAWWPADAVNVRHGSYLYKAAHTTPGGSPTSRVLAYYAGDGRILRMFTVFRELTDAVRDLDARGADPARAQCLRFDLPALPV